MAFMQAIRPACKRLRVTEKYYRVGFARDISHASSPQDTVATIKSERTPNPPAIDPMSLDPETVTTRKEERTLIYHRHVHPIGSRRRRAAIQSSDGVPFEQMPYQCFQEARKILAEDRNEKLAQIEETRRRIAKFQSLAAEHQGGENAKRGRLGRMQKHLEELKILADINDPSIKKRFEDGMGDMNRPIYRHLANKKWREYDRLILMQRISQFHIVPDLLHHFDPTCSVKMAFGRRNVKPGEIVDSRVSEIPLRLNAQVYDKGERLVTVAVMDPDVPDPANDTFQSRCHFLAANIPLSPTQTSIPLSQLKADQQVVFPWLPPYSQKGAPYHRLVVFVLQQEGPQLIDLAGLKQQQAERDGWRVKTLMTKQKKLLPIGAAIFRTVWDEGMDGVMERLGVAGRELELVRQKPEKNVYKKKDGARYR